MTFEMNYLVFSIIFLIIGVLVGYFIYSRLNKNKSDQNKDLETLKTEVEETFKVVFKQNCDSNSESNKCCLEPKCKPYTK